MKLHVRNDIAENLPWPVTMRFGTVLLSCVLLAMSCGPELTAAMAKHCYLCGLCGLAFYFSLEFVAQQRAHSQARAAARAAEKRLSRRMQTQKLIDEFHRDSAVAEVLGDIESAMDSKADFETYVGLQTQPTLSV